MQKTFPRKPRSTVSYGQGRSAERSSTEHQHECDHEEEDGLCAVDRDRDQGTASATSGQCQREGIDQEGLRNHPRQVQVVGGDKTPLTTQSARPNAPMRGRSRPRNNSSSPSAVLRMNMPSVAKGPHMTFAVGARSPRR